MPMTPSAPTEHQPVTWAHALSAQAVAVVGDLLLHAERQVLPDFLSAYTRLNRTLGRQVSDVPPSRDMLGFSVIRRPSTGHPMDAYAVSLVEVVVTVIGAAIRNANALDAERHWQEADRAVRGWAAKEHQAEAARAETCRREAEVFTDNENDGAAADAIEAAIRHLNQAKAYEFWLADNGGL